MGTTVHVNDVDTGLTYMQQRYYDPVAGRFLSTDPVITDNNSGASFNRYIYANNNPYRYIDPDGRFSDQACADMVGNCSSVGGSSERTKDVKSGIAIGSATGAVVGAFLSGGCDYFSFGICVPANPGIVGGSAVLGGIAGGLLAPPVMESSRNLAKNIEAAVGVSKKPGDHSHHIVAENDPRAALSRAILLNAGMSVDSAFNGMTMSPAHHNGIHTNLYHATVAATLFGANDYATVAARLTIIRAEIYMGIFPK